MNIAKILLGALNVAILTLLFSSLAESQIIPEGTTTISDGAYYNRQDITDLVIPSTVTTIGWNAFGACGNLTNLIIPNTVTRLGIGSFFSTGIKSVVLPGSLDNTGSNVFQNCHALEQVVINEGVKEIGYAVFDNCWALENISIPNTVTNIGVDAFGRCLSLSNIIIPNSVTTIADEAFINCSGLTNITIPNGIVSIGANAFSACSNLVSIALPDSLIMIGANAFSGCPKLTTIKASSDLMSYLGINQQSLGLNREAVSNFLPTSAAVLTTNLPANPLFCATLASNTNFLSALTAAIAASPGSYNVLMQGPAGVQGPQGATGTFDPTVLTNTAFLCGLASNSTFISAISTNPVFLAAISQGLAGSTNNYGFYQKQLQTLTFPSIAPTTYAIGKSLKLAVTSSAKLTPVTYTSSNDGIASVSGSALTITGAGTVTITATQAGNLTTAPATATQVFVVTPVVQTLKFGAIPAQTYAVGKTVKLGATSSAKLTSITYISSNEGVATVNGNVLTLVGQGTSVITATQAGDGNTTSASAAQILTVK